MKNDIKSVSTAFVELTEKIANSRTNVLDFGSPDMTFYRGEIHMIKMIGDFPGIYSSELARKFGVTRAVVHKTLLKLQDRELITKEVDEKDKKRFRLFLTEKGREAYDCHEAYHAKYDKILVDHIASLSDDQLATVSEFLSLAARLIENHS